MTGRVTALGRAGLAQGLGLAGLPVREVRDVGAGLEELAALVAAESPLVLLVEDDVLAAAPPALARRIASQPMPIVLPVPGPAGELRRGAAEEEILEILRQAIGYRVRLR